MHTHTHRHPHTQAFRPYKAKIYTAQNRQEMMPRRPGIDEDISMDQKTWKVYNLGIFFYRLDLNESKEGFCQRGRGWTKNRKGAETNSGEYGVRNPEAESIGS